MRIDNEVVIRQKISNMFKIFRRTELIMTNSTAYKRIHANAVNDLQLSLKAASHIDESTWRSLANSVSLSILAHSGR